MSTSLTIMPSISVALKPDLLVLGCANGRSGACEKPCGGVAERGEIGTSSSDTFTGILNRKFELRRTGASSSSCQERLCKFAGLGAWNDEFEMDELVEDCELKGCEKASAGKGKMFNARSPEASAPP